MDEGSHLKEEDYPVMEPAPKSFQLFTEVVGWLQIFASPFFAGLLIGTVVYLSLGNELGLIIGGVLAGAGLIIGIIWATRVWRKKGTSRFMSMISSTPDIDDINRR